MDNSQRLRELLVKQRFLDGLSDEHCQRLASIGRVVGFRAGTEIFKEGGRADELYLLVTGRVELCMNIPARGCTPILTLEEGDLLGWSAALGSGEMTASALATTDVEAIGLPGGPLRLLCEQDHTIGFEFMRRVAAALSRRLVATRLQALDLFASPAEVGPAAGPGRGR